MEARGAFPLRSSGDRETRKRDTTLDTTSSNEAIEKKEQRRAVTSKEGHDLVLTSSSTLQLLDNIATMSLTRALLKQDPLPTFTMPKFRMFDRIGDRSITSHKQVMTLYIDKDTLLYKVYLFQAR